MWDDHQDVIRRTFGQTFLVTFHRLPVEAREEVRRDWEVRGGPAIEDMLEPNYATPPQGLLIAIRDAADADGSYHLGPDEG